MPIPSPSITHTPTLTCVICHAPVSAREATAGSVQLDGSLAIACTAHLRERRTWFTAWCAFESQLRHKQQAKAANVHKAAAR